MKLLLCFIQKEDNQNLLRRLRENHTSVTAIETEGGFLGKKNTTLLLAVEENDIPSVLALIREICTSRTERVDATFASGGIESVGLPTSTDISIGGATILQLSVESVTKY